MRILYLGHLFWHGLWDTKYEDGGWKRVFTFMTQILSQYAGRGRRTTGADQDLFHVEQDEVVYAETMQKKGIGRISQGGDSNVVKVSLVKDPVIRLEWRTDVQQLKAWREEYEEEGTEATQFTQDVKKLEAEKAGSETAQQEEHSLSAVAQQMSDRLQCPTQGPAAGTLQYSSTLVSKEEYAADFNKFLAHVVPTFTKSATEQFQELQQEDDTNKPKVTFLQTLAILAGCDPYGKGMQKHITKLQKHWGFAEAAQARTEEKLFEKNKDKAASKQEAASKLPHELEAYLSWGLVVADEKDGLSVYLVCHRLFNLIK